MESEFFSHLQSVEDVRGAAQQLGYEVTESDGSYNLVPLAGRDGNTVHEGLNFQQFRELIQQEALDAVLMGFVL